VRFTGFFIILGMAWVGFTAAFAQDIDGQPCIPGVPCKVELTPNDPNTRDDGPNRDGAPNAPKHSDSDACDADFMNQIYAKAWLEAERQNVIGEILIRKPDSVLEYSCFNQMASLIAEDGGPLFTESEEWDDEEVEINGEINTEQIEDVQINTFMEDDRLDTAIENVILQSLQEYLDSNFDHAFLGGASSMEFETAGIDMVTDQPYNCPHMNLINFDSKCTNFNEDTNFYTFEELARLADGDSDPRLLAEACDGRNALDSFDDIIEVAENEDFRYVAFDRAQPTFLDRVIDSSDCSSVEPIPTGLMYMTETFTVNQTTGKVTRQEGEEIQDKVCPKPGCFYSGTDDECQ